MPVAATVPTPLELLGGAGLGRRDENGGQADGGLTASFEREIRSQELGIKGSESGKQRYWNCLARFGILFSSFN